MATINHPTSGTRRGSTPPERAPFGSEAGDYAQPGSDAVVGQEQQSLTIKVRPDNDWVVVALVGEIDVTTAPRVRSAIRGLLLIGLVRIVVDLDAVTFLGATGMEALITATNEVAHEGGTLELTHHPRLMRLLKLTGETRRVNLIHGATHAASGLR